MDEATANIDLITEQKIQELIADQFSDCTVLTIAHRLQTIVESDNILVLEDGQAVEYDTPANLLKDESSHFTKLVEEMKNSGDNM
jgi:ABC-type multidrug transport system fused ATPase/permease subunit